MAFLITGKTQDGKRIVQCIAGQRFMTDDEIEIEAGAHEKNAQRHGATAHTMREQLAIAKEQD